ncbi:hypothetical protein Hanom_Chr06g00553261 [Helianthus anomalus]
MAKMFDEQENKNIADLNDWASESWFDRRNDKNVGTKRFENFLCMKHESLEKLDKRFDDLIDKLDSYKIGFSNDEKI